MSRTNLTLLRLSSQDEPRFTAPLFAAWKRGFATYEYGKMLEAAGRLPPTNTDSLRLLSS